MQKLNNNIWKIIFEYDPTFHNHFRENILSKLEKKWCVKYIQKNGHWGWKLGNNLYFCDTSEIPRNFQNKLLKYFNPYYNFKIYKKYFINFNDCHKLCKYLNKLDDKYYIPDHIYNGDKYNFHKNFYITKYQTMSSYGKIDSNLIYPHKWKIFKNLVEKDYK